MATMRKLVALQVLALTSFFIASEAKFSLSSLTNDFISGGREGRSRLSQRISRLSENVHDPCARYRDAVDLPAGHPCAPRFSRLSGVVKHGSERQWEEYYPPPGGRHPDGAGHHPPGVGHHCNHNPGLCVDPQRNPYLHSPNPLNNTRTTCCSKTCVSLFYSRKHCGVCFHKCKRGEGCCPRGHPLNGTCINTRTDPNNCGYCDRKCNPGDLCQAGKCVPYY